MKYTLDISQPYIKPETKFYKRFDYEIEIWKVEDDCRWYCFENHEWKYWNSLPHDDMTSMKQISAEEAFAEVL